MQTCCSCLVVTPGPVELVVGVQVGCLLLFKTRMGHHIMLAARDACSASCQQKRGLALRIFSSSTSSNCSCRVLFRHCNPSCYFQPDISAALTATCHGAATWVSRFKGCSSSIRMLCWTVKCCAASCISMLCCPTHLLQDTVPAAPCCAVMQAARITTWKAHAACHCHLAAEPTSPVARPMHMAAPKKHMQASWTTQPRCLTAQIQILLACGGLT
jgi:hypothetical protein